MLKRTANIKKIQTPDSIWAFRNAKSHNLDLPVTERS